ncbi:MAG: hypothetical protein EA385_06735 [Salinarimonadaceae bacterium]|nr:MAG: hypothetical protein EA385_06735 [Salinarimonadaceae bacterium]
MLKPRADTLGALALACAVSAMTFAHPAPAAANGEFLQFDFAPRASSATATVRRDRATLTLGWSEFQTGHATTLWGNYGLPLGEGAWFRAGPAFRIDDAGRTKAGGRIGVERFSMNEQMTMFLLAEFNTIQKEYLALGQIGHRASGLAAEVAYQGNETGFRELTFAGSYRVGDSPVRLRVGYRTIAKQFFIGVTVNTF